MNTMPEKTPAQRLAKIDAIIAGIKQQMKQPAFEPETSNQVRERADRRRAYAQQAMLNGREVIPAYLPMEQEDGEY